MMLRWMVNDISSMGFALEKNHWLEMGRETHSNITFFGPGILQE